MIGQYRKCAFCKKRFRLQKEKRFLGLYKFVTLANKSTGDIRYGHAKCYWHFRETKSTESMQKFSAGFSVRDGIFLRGEISFS